MKHDLPFESSSLLKDLEHPTKSVSSKRTLTYNEVSTLLQDLQEPVRTTLLRYLTHSPIKMSQQ